MTGILEGNMNSLKFKAMQNNGIVEIDHVVDYVLEMQRGKLDAHVVIGGQNGLGKSYFMLALAKKIISRDLREAEKTGELEFIFAYHERAFLEHEIRYKKKCVFAIDELRPFFDYKNGMIGEQIGLYNAVEIARSNANIFIGCTRNYRKLEKNYRNAKAQVLIYFFDKVLDKTRTDENGFYETKYVYGAVFVGNSAMEGEDKFGFGFLAGQTLENAKYYAERLPTYVGTIVFKNIKTYGITEEEIKIYEEEKAKGICLDEKQIIVKRIIKETPKVDEIPEEKIEEAKKEKKKCAYEGCEEKYYSRGFCFNHYRQERLLRKKQNKIILKR